MAATNLHKLVRAAAPLDTQVYAINGQVIFPIYAPSGGLSAAVCSFIIKRERVETKPPRTPPKYKYWASQVRLTLNDTPESASNKVSLALNAMKEIEPGEHLPDSGLTFNPAWLSPEPV